jgi:hypothetical protein
VRIHGKDDGEIDKALSALLSIASTGF